MLFVGLASLIGFVGLVRAANLVSRAERVLDRLDNVLLHLQDAVTAQRDYLVTGDSTYLTPYRGALVVLTRDTAALRRLTADNAAQQARVDSLGTLLMTELALLDSSVSLRQRAGVDAVIESFRSDRGRRALNDVRLAVRGMQREERALLDARTRRLRFVRQALFAIIIGGSLLAFLLAVRFNRAIRRDVIEQEKVQEQLEQQAEQLTEQAAELEQQMEEGQALTEELAQTNSELVLSTAEADAARRHAIEARREAETSRDRIRESEERYRALAEASSRIVWRADVMGLVSDIPEWRALTGQTVEEVRGQGWASAIHAEDIPRISRAGLDAFEARAPYEAEFRARMTDGAYRWFRARAVPLLDDQGAIREWVGTFDDIDDRRQAELRTAFLAEASSLLGISLEVEDTLQTITRHCVPFLADYCSVDRLDEDGEIRRVASAHVDPEKEQLVLDVWHRYPYRVSERVGVPEVMRTGAAILVPSFPDDAIAEFARDEEHLALLRRLDPRSYICVPLVARGRAFGAISLVCSDSGRRYTAGDLETAEELARRAGNAVDNARLYDAEKQASAAAHEAARRLRFLAEASALLGSSLEFERTLTSIARLAVPDIADWCAVDLVRDDGRVETLAIAHADPRKVDWARALRERYPVDPNGHTGVARVLRSGRAERVETITDEMLVAAAIDEEQLSIIREVGLQSQMIVPLVARGRTLGAISLVAAESGVHFSEADLALAEELARRAAIAIDNARLFREAEGARADAVSANKAKSDFLATMSHEIRTPINAVLGYSELLELGLSGPLTEEQRNQITRIRSSTRHLLGLVNEVLDLAKIESGTLRVDRAWALAGDTVDAALTLVRPQAAARKIVISERCEGLRESPYLGDEHRVRQVLTNLLANAVKFTDPGGKITVTCATTDEPPASVSLPLGKPFVAIRVSDTGIGIAPDHLARIFEPFTQGEDSDFNPYTRERSGTGLGLAISRQLAQLMDGEITVESTVGAGSVFTLWVPGPERREEVRDRAQPPDAAQKRRVSPFLGATAAIRTGRISAEVPGARQRYRDELEDIAGAMLGATREIVDEWVARLRADDELPQARVLTPQQLEDHAATFVTDIAIAIGVLGQAGDEPSELLRDGTAILRTISEQHGRQRFRHRWTERGILREMQHLRDVAEVHLRRLAAGLDPKAVTAASAMAAQRIDQGTRVSVAAYRVAEGGGAPTEPG